MSFNKCVLIGNLCADPELKNTTTGKTVTTFRIGVGRKMQKDQTDFLDIVAWNKTAEFVARCFRKGSSILVCGAIQTRAYEAQDGTKRKVVEVVADEVSFVEKRRDAGEAQTVPNSGPPMEQMQAVGGARPMFEPAGYNRPQQAPVQFTPTEFEEMTREEELPF